MGFLTKLAGRQTEDEELVRFQQMTRKPEWDIVLEMLLFPVEEDRLNFHNLKGEALKEAQIRTEIYLKLLGQVEAAGGRTTLEPQENQQPKPPEHEFASERDLGVLHFRTDEARRAEGEREDAR